MKKPYWNTGAVIEEWPKMDGDFNCFASNSKAKDFWDDEFGDDLILKVTQETEQIPNHVERK